jgi:hypothetical protein
MGKMAAAALAAMTIGLPAQAQQASDTLAEQWRAARAAELDADVQALQKERAALATATPPTSPPAAESDGKESFGGKFRLGAGISFTSDIGSRDRVGAASLDPAGIVRVSDQNNTRARIMLEGHYFIEPCHSFFGMRRNVCHRKEGYDYETQGPDRLIASTWGWGPFVAVQPGGDDKVIDAVGMGVMVGFRKDPKSGQSFNIGFGYVVDPNTQVLGDGIRRDQPLPPGETEVRFKETTQTGLLFLVSFGF